MRSLVRLLCPAAPVAALRLVRKCECQRRPDLPLSVGGFTCSPLRHGCDGARGQLRRTEHASWAVGPTRLSILIGRRSTAVVRANATWTSSRRGRAAWALECCGCGHPDAGGRDRARVAVSRAIRRSVPRYSTYHKLTIRRSKLVEIKGTVRDAGLGVPVEPVLAEPVLTVASAGGFDSFRRSPLAAARR